jgi:antitoxin (DNA-binding transcriptional repressor) of toxin-antitoxin stability system
LPEQFAERPISDVVRALSREGWNRAEISRVTGILYQHVRNILEGAGINAGRRVESSTKDEASATIERDAVGGCVAFADLVRQVQQGEEITVTHDGAPVARIVPVEFRRSGTTLEAALVRMDERRKRLGPHGLSVKELINEGRP